MYLFRLATDQAVDHIKQTFYENNQRILRHSNWNKISAYLRNVLITELMTNKNGTRNVILKEIPSSSL